MKVIAKQNRDLVMINAQNTQNENDAEKILLQVPEKYEDFNKKIVFITPDGNVWDIITNNEYLIKKAITKYNQVDFYIWLTKEDVDFRSQTKTLKFYHNVDASDEITDEEIGRVNTVVNLLEQEITKVEDLEDEIDGKLEEINTAIDDVNSAIQETENLDLDANKINSTTTVTITKKDGTEKSVSILDGQDGTDGENLQFIWQGTSLGIKTETQQEYTFVNLQGVQGPIGPQGEPFTIKKTYTSISQMNADFNNMQLGDYVMIASSVEVEDNAKLYTRGESQWIFITDFSGATGIRGETGLTPNIQIGTVTQGSSFSVTRTGTNENPLLNFTLVKGDNGTNGQDGYTPVKGVDYFTEQDIASLNIPPKMAILKYGISTWADFMQAYKENAIVYCRASSADDPAIGAQTRLAFMAFVNRSDVNPSYVEFQYYRSVATHTDNQQGDQVFIYQLNPKNVWTVTVRNAFSKIEVGTGINKSYLNNSVILSLKDVYVPVSGTTPTIVAEEDKIYKCGEVTTLSFTPSSTGLCEVIFTSGTTPTVLTLPNTVKMPDWFEIEANHTYEISILDGVYGAVMSWES